MSNNTDEISLNLSRGEINGVGIINSFTNLLATSPLASTVTFFISICIIFYFITRCKTQQNSGSTQSLDGVRIANTGKARLEMSGNSKNNLPRRQIINDSTIDGEATMTQRR